MAKFTHTTKSGEVIELSKISDRHLQNIIAMLERKAADGVTVRYGGGSTADDIWYDEDVLFGDEALDYLHYGEYVADEGSKCSISP